MRLQRTGYLFLSLLLLLLICLGSFPVSAAPEQGAAVPEVQQEENGATPEGLVAAVLDSNPEDASEPVVTPPSVPKTTYRKVFNYSGDILLSGIFQSQGYYFEVENYWDCGYAYAQIEFTLSQLIDDVPASLTFSVNSTPVYSCKVDYKKGKTQTVYVSIPVELLNTGFNEFAITGYVRLYDDDGCLDDLSGANWVNISKNSMIQVGYEAKDPQHKISYYPYPFISTMDSMGDNSAIYLPEDYTESELTCAMLLRADLGTETVEEDHISLKTLDQFSADQKKNKVVVALYDKIPASLSKAMGNPTADLEKNAMVRFVEDGRGNPVLLVTSKSEACLEEAVAMLMDESRVTQEKSSAAYIPEGAAQKMKESSKLSDLVAGKYTVEGLVGSGLSFIGPFHQDKDIFMPFSGGYVLAEAGKVVLNFRYSDNLDFKRSLVTVYWGDVPVYSKKLTKENAAGDTLSFTMPADVVGTTATKISIAFDLEIQDMYCTYRSDEMPWAYVSGDSTFYLPIGESSRLSFSTRPYPFQTLGLFHNAAVVVPDSMTDVELDLLGQIMGVYGDTVSPYGELKTIKAGNFSKDDADYNLIVVGTYQDNPVLADLNGSLSFQFDGGGEKFLSNDQLILSDAYGRDIGVLQLIRSPYAEGKAVLAAVGPQDKTLGYLSSFLSVEKNQWKLADDTFLVDKDLEYKSYRFLADNGSAAKPTLREQLEQNKNAIIFTLVSTAAMVLLLLAVVLVLLRAYRMKKQGRE